MTTRVAALVAVVLAAGAALADEGVLYWMVDGSAAISGTDQTVRGYFGTLDVPDGSEFAARVRVTGGGLTEDTFLDLYYSNEYGDTWFDDGRFGVAFDDSGSGYWGAGVPEGSQSSIGGFGSPEYSFTVELGNVVWFDDQNSDGTWTTVATSATVAYSALIDYIHTDFDMNPGTSAVWSPMAFTAVPEPSGGLLALFGMALLALRRRRQ